MTDENCNSSTSSTPVDTESNETSKNRKEQVDRIFDSPIEKEQVEQVEQVDSSFIKKNINIKEGEGGGVNGEDMAANPKGVDGLPVPNDFPVIERENLPVPLPVPKAKVTQITQKMTKAPKAPKAPTVPKAPKVKKGVWDVIQELHTNGYNFSRDSVGDIYLLQVDRAILLKSNDGKDIVKIECLQSVGMVTDGIIKNTILTIEALTCKQLPIVNIINRVYNLHEGLLFYSTGIGVYVVTPKGVSKFESTRLPTLNLYYLKRQDLTRNTPLPDLTAPPALLQEFFNFINIPDVVSQVKIIGALVNSFFTRQPQVVVFLNGVHDSGKTFTTCCLKLLVDPITLPCTDKASVMGVPRNIQDYNIRAFYNHIITIDNIRGNLSEELINKINTIATGEGVQERTLFTNMGDTTFSLKRCQILSGIEVPSSLIEFLDRCVIVNMESIDKNQKRDESELFSQFNQNHAKYLGAFLNLISRVMKELPDLDKSPSYHRMKKYYDICRAVCKILNVPEVDFVNEMKEDFEEKKLSSLYNSHTTIILMDAIAQGEFGVVGEWHGGSFHELHEVLINYYNKNRDSYYSKGIPPINRNNNIFGKDIADIITQLPKYGVNLKIEKKYPREVTLFFDVKKSTVVKVDIFDDGGIKMNMKVEE